MRPSLLCSTDFFTYSTQGAKCARGLERMAEGEAEQGSSANPLAFDDDDDDDDEVHVLYADDDDDDDDDVGAPPPAKKAN